MQKGTSNENRLLHLSERYRPALLAYFLRRIRDHAEAEDLTQEVFLRLARRDGNGLPADSAYAYIFQTAANLLRDRSRRQRVRLAYAASARDLCDGDVDTLDPARHVEGRAELTALATHIGAMPERMRQAFLLYRFEGIGKSMIADSLGVSISTVEKDVAAALAILVQKLGRMP